MNTPAGHRGRGRLKVYLGYAAGVGKTYRMLEEAQALRQKSADIVIGYFEPHHSMGDQRVRLSRSPIDRLIDAAEGFDLRLFPHPEAR